MRPSGQNEEFLRALEASIFRKTPEGQTLARIRDPWPWPSPSRRKPRLYIRRDMYLPEVWTWWGEFGAYTCVIGPVGMIRIERAIAKLVWAVQEQQNG